MAAAVLGRGFSLHRQVHPHGSIGAVSAALAAAVSLGLSARQKERAVRLSASLANASQWNACTEGATIRHVYAGQGARTGLTAAFLAESGFSEVNRSLDEAFGSILGTPNDSTNGQDDSGGWAILNGYVKRWPACAFTHTALDLAERARADIPVPDAVRRMVVEVPKVCLLVAQHQAPTELAVRFSIPMLIAALLHGLDLIRDIDAVRTSEVLRDLAARISVHENAAMTADWPLHMAARLHVDLADGTMIDECAVDPWQPTSDAFYEYVQRKAGLLLGTGRARHLGRLVDKLDETQLPTGLLRPAR